MICLNLNESPYDLMHEIKEEVICCIRQTSLNRYPQRDALEEDLARFYRVSRENISVGNGSDEMIQLLAMAYGQRGKTVTISPTFSMYRHCVESVGGTVEEIPLRDDFSLDMPRLLKASSNASLVFLCSPNNPTGNIIPRSQLEQVVASTAGVVVIDEAYGEYCSNGVDELINQSDNIVMLRTFSKAWSLAGARLGVAIGSRAPIKELEALRLPFNLNALTIALARVILEVSGGKGPRISPVITERKRVFDALKQLPGIVPYQSETNFILFKTETDAKALWEGLQERQILVRYFENDSRLKDCLRVSIGLPQENTAFLMAMEDLLCGK